MQTRSAATGLPLVGQLLARLNLRYPTLFGLLATVSALNLMLPDPIPLLDELALVLLTLLVGRVKAGGARRR